MPRLAVLIIVLVVVLGALVFLSTLAKQHPTHTIEVPVAMEGNAH